MRLSPHEIDKILLCNAGYLAQKRLARGIRLNFSESIALLSFQILEFARDGNFTVSELMNLGRSILGKNQVIPGVESIIDEVQIEATFPDGTKLVTLHHPISQLTCDLELALKGSFLPVPSDSSFRTHPEEGLIPGYIHSLQDKLILNEGRKLIALKVNSILDTFLNDNHIFLFLANPIIS